MCVFFHVLLRTREMGARDRKRRLEGSERKREREIIQVSISSNLCKRKEKLSKQRIGWFAATDTMLPQHAPLI